MSIKDLFSFESKKKREKRRKQYYSRLFPFGSMQQEREKKVLSELFPGSQNPDEQQFLLITLREALLNTLLEEDDDDYVTREAALENWKNGPSARRLSDREQKLLLILADKENAAAGQEELPSAQDVLNSPELM